MLSVLYAGFQDVAFVEALFYGLKPAVLAVVVEAVIRIGRRALKNEVMVTLAALAFIAIFFFDVPFPLIVIAAGLIGYVGGKFREDTFYVIKGYAASTAQSDALITDAVAAQVRPQWSSTWRTAAVWLVLWLAPVAVLAAVLGTASVWTTEAVFFSKAAVVTFGGAYAVLAYIAQQAVETYGFGRVRCSMGSAWPRRRRGRSSRSCSSSASWERIAIPARSIRCWPVCLAPC